MRTLRKRLAAGNPDAASNAAMHPQTWTPQIEGGVVAGYAPQGSELDPAPLIAELVEMGWTPCLPRAADRESALSFHAVDGPLTLDAFGIVAPAPTSPRLIPDLVLVPVLAFDRAGGRLGQGAGCYDRTIAALRATRTVRVVGLAYAGQEVDWLPTGEHDQPLDGILTDTGYLAVVRPYP